MAAEKKIVLITGANTGLGFETAKALFQSTESYHVLVGCRGDVSRADEAVETLEKDVPDSNSTAEGFSIDVTSDESINKAFEHLQAKFGHLDFLINNAGAAFPPTTREGWNKAWDTNVTGAYFVTAAFMPMLIKAKVPTARLLFITSGLSSLTEVAEGRQPPHITSPPAGWPKASGPFPALAYRSAKTGLNMMALDWARVLKNDPVEVFTISPGMLATGLGGNREALVRAGALHPAVGANFIRDVIEGKRDELAGAKVLRKDAVQEW